MDGMRQRVPPRTPRRYGATVSTRPFQGRNTGSIPVSATRILLAVFETSPLNIFRVDCGHENVGHMGVARGSNRGAGIFSVLRESRRGMERASYRRTGDCHSSVLPLGAGTRATAEIIRGERAGQRARYARNLFQNSESRLHFWRNFHRRVDYIFRTAAVLSGVSDSDSHAVDARPRRAAGA